MIRVTSSVQNVLMELYVCDSGGRSSLQVQDSHVRRRCILTVQHLPPACDPSFHSPLDFSRRTIFNSNSTKNSGSRPCAGHALNLSLSLVRNVCHAITPFAHTSECVENMRASIHTSDSQSGKKHHSAVKATVESLMLITGATFRERAITAFVRTVASIV